MKTTLRTAATAGLSVLLLAAASVAGAPEQDAPPSPAANRSETAHVPRQ